MATSTPRRTVEDWVQAGLTLLAEDGLPAVKIDRLCQGLGVTKGSFYWHFEDIQSFLDALQEEWKRSRAEQRAVYADTPEMTPRERMETMMALLMDPRETRLERAMREWARSDSRVRGRVARWDKWVLAELQGGFRELGFDEDDVEVRARTLFLAGIGYIHTMGAGAPSTPAQRDALMDLVTRR